MDASTSTLLSCRHVEFVMGTAVSFDLRDSMTVRTGLDDAIAWLHHVDRTFSPYIEHSEISRIGRGELSLVDACHDVQGILEWCEELRNDTHGAFDAWAVPAPNDTFLDPCGVVKGWSIERAAQILETHGHARFTINAGGDVTVRGRPGPARAWTVGIRHPDQPDMLAAVLAVEGPMAVATSATHERGAHIIDPRTGCPTTAIASATVVGPDLGLADAYATAVFVMGIDGLAWLAERLGFEGFVITHEATTSATPGFDRLRTRSPRTVE